MAQLETYILIGATRKPYGTEGEIKLKIEPQYLEDVLQTSVLFLSVQGKPLPYFVENMRAADHLIVKLEEVDSKEVAQRLSSKEIFLRESDLVPEEKRQFEVEDDRVYKDLIGYTLMDEALGAIGLIKEIEEYPQQEMALLVYQGKDILIPLNEQLILEIDAKEKVLRMQLPEGILTL